jgi:CheY-like chemotaxis protein
VLVVDDNPTNRRILEEMLLGWQLRPDSVDGAEAALRALDAAFESGDPYQFVVTDALMPQVDGFALATSIQRDPRFAGVPIVMLTSAGRTLPSVDGISACLTKPVKQSELLDAILTATGSHPDRAEAAQVALAREVPGRRLRILVAEDNATNQRLVVALLEKWGHDVTVASNGREAVDLSEGDGFDVILMDVQMPEMNGLDATAAIRLREQADGGHVPIVAMTAHALASDREECLEAGMDAYVSKPLRARDLFDAIERISGAAGEAPVREPADGPDADVIHVPTLIANLGGNQDLVRDVIEVFLGDSPAMLAAGRQAASDHDGEKLAGVAHALKGSIGLFSRGRTFEIAREIETRARAGDLTEAGDAVARLEHAVGALGSQLRAVRDSLQR